MAKLSQGAIRAMKEAAKLLYKVDAQINKAVKFHNAPNAEHSLNVAANAVERAFAAVENARMEEEAFVDDYYND